MTFRPDAVVGTPVYVEPWGDLVFWHQYPAPLDLRCAGKAFPHIDCSRAQLEELKAASQ